MLLTLPVSSQWRLRRCSERVDSRACWNCGANCWNAELTDWQQRFPSSRSSGSTKRQQFTLSETSHSVSAHVLQSEDAPPHPPDPPLCSEQKSSYTSQTCNVLQLKATPPSSADVMHSDRREAALIDFSQQSALCYLVNIACEVGLRRLMGV